ncbi:uncharacterized protein L969DRAFT_74407 [Mixia osmundae IAM 14324]|uniref:Methyltransferase type 11 domain-containing protein n=1 Tax=Mixia osmundae (strain CBS 9802 / IAM 14324 / JCM 22182 / KY 12970) TaxID=764103 RepID=G7E3E3_MIXOS|nr:uncharacterized protein L969DRAFT_74407 [Mixia osmundae IAM 14324]KEI39339.1 hypothetical protein L969DRAFT_74407 [Mixia osmundae IAM 14324]GAA97353.1 hypothetical protein E5Q_04031 [Mixia osmundae IAM 14324]
MTSFAKAAFDSAAYLACRPRYSKELVKQILDYGHFTPSTKSGRTAVDLGCGPGQLTAQLASTNAFEHVYGLDPSAKMLSRGMQADPPAPRISYRQSSAERLECLADSSVDLLTASQAAHWFDHSKVWPELLRVLKPGGLVAYLNYGECEVPTHPEVSRIIGRHSHVTLAPHWQQPGRDIAENLLDEIAFPGTQGWDKSSFERRKFDRGNITATLSDVAAPPPTTHHPIAFKLDWTIDQLTGYLRTWSAAHNYDEAHGGDVVDQVARELQTLLPASPETFEIVWPGITLFARKAR